MNFIHDRIAAKPEETDVIHDFLAFLADQMIQVNKNRQTIITEFLHWLKNKIIQVPMKDIKNKTKIEEFYKNTLHSLIGILKQNNLLPQVISLGNERYEKLKRAYNATMRKLSPLEEKITKTDNLIDQVVYQLYNLTEDEITTVEEFCEPTYDSEFDKS